METDIISINDPRRKETKAEKFSRQKDAYDITRFGNLENDMRKILDTYANNQEYLNPEIMLKKVQNSVSSIITHNKRKVGRYEFYLHEKPYIKIDLLNSWMNPEDVLNEVIQYEKGFTEAEAAQYIEWMDKGLIYKDKPRSYDEFPIEFLNNPALIKHQFPYVSELTVYDEFQIPHTVEVVRPDIDFRSKFKYTSTLPATQMTEDGDFVESNKMLDIVQTLSENKKTLNKIVKHDLFAIQTAVVAMSKLFTEGGNKRTTLQFESPILRALIPHTAPKSYQNFYPYLNRIIKTFVGHQEVFQNSKFLYENLFSESWKSEHGYNNFLNIFRTLSDERFNRAWDNLGTTEKDYILHNVLDHFELSIPDQYRQIFGLSNIQIEKLKEYMAGLEVFKKSLKMEHHEITCLGVGIKENLSPKVLSSKLGVNLIESLLSQIFKQNIEIFNHVISTDEKGVSHLIYKKLASILNEGTMPTMNEITWLRFGYIFCASVLFGDGSQGIAKFETWLEARAHDSNFYQDTSDTAYQMECLEKNPIHSETARLIIGPLLTNLRREVSAVPIIGTSTYKLEKCMSWYEATVPYAFTVVKNIDGTYADVPLDINDKIAMMSLQQLGSLMKHNRDIWERLRSGLDRYSVTGLTTKGIEGDYSVTFGRKFERSAMKSVYIEVAGMNSIEYLLYKPLDLIFLSLKRGVPIITMVPDKILTPYQASKLGVDIMTLKQYYQLRFEHAGVFIPVLTESEFEQFGHAQTLSIDVVRNGEGFDSYFDWIQWLYSPERTDNEYALIGLTREKAEVLANSFGVDGGTPLNGLGNKINFWFYCLQQSDQYQFVLPNVQENSPGHISCDQNSWNTWNTNHLNPTSSQLSPNHWSFLSFQIYIQQIQQWAIDEDLGKDTLQLGYLEIYYNYYLNQYQGESQGFGDDFWTYYAGNIFPKKNQN